MDVGLPPAFREDYPGVDTHAALLAEIERVFKHVAGGGYDFAQTPLVAAVWQRTKNLLEWMTPSEPAVYYSSMPTDAARLAISTGSLLGFDFIFIVIFSRC